MWRNLAALLLSSVVTLGALELMIHAGVVPLPDFFESSGWWNEHWQRGKRGAMPQEFVKLDSHLGWIPAPDLDRQGSPDLHELGFDPWKTRLHARAVQEETHRGSGRLVRVRPVPERPRDDPRFALVYLPTLEELEAEPVATAFLAAECAAQDWLCIGPGPRVAETWPTRRRRKQHFKCHYSAPLADLIAEPTAERIQAS